MYIAKLIITDASGKHLRVISLDNEMINHLRKHPSESESFMNMILDILCKVQPSVNLDLTGEGDVL